MQNFPDCIAHVLVAEGGLVNDPQDPGGVTKFGISQRSYPALDIRELTPERQGERLPGFTPTRIHGSPAPRYARQGPRGGIQPLRPGAGGALPSRRRRSIAGMAHYIQPGG